MHGETVKLRVHLVGFIIRIYHEAQSPERQIGIHLAEFRTVLQGVKIKF